MTVSRGVLDWVITFRSLQTFESFRLRPHSRERWPVVGVGVAVHHGGPKTRRGADRQGALGPIWTQLLLQVTTKIQTFKPVFTSTSFNLDEF